MRMQCTVHPTRKAQDTDGPPEIAVTTGFAMLVIAAAAGVMGIALIAAAIILRDEAKTDRPVDGLSVYRLSRIIDECPDVRPRLARALLDDRITLTEAKAIEDEERRLDRISSDATFPDCPICWRPAVIAAPVLMLWR